MCRTAKRLVTKAIKHPEINVPASVQIAHRSRRFTICTVSQTQNAPKAAARAGSTIVMPAILPRRQQGGKADRQTQDYYGRGDCGSSADLQPRQRPLQLGNSLIGDLRPLQLDLFQLRQRIQLCQSAVGQGRVV